MKNTLEQLQQRTLQSRRGRYFDESGDDEQRRVYNTDELKRIIHSFFLTRNRVAIDRVIAD